MKLGKMSLVLALTLSLAGAAGATHIHTLTGTADCDGFEFSGTIRFGSGVHEATLSYQVDLAQDGTTILSVADAVVVTGDPYEMVPFAVSGTWDQDLCGIYTVSGSAITDPGDGVPFTFSFPDLDCDCPPEDTGCFRTPGYWKNHDWPVDGLMLAGAEMSRDELMTILWTPVRGDATVILAKHLIAAKLNVISGADDGIQGVIDDADDFLADHPVFSRPNGALKAMALDLKDDLMTYNEQGCPEDDGDEDKAAAVENTSWSDLKELYR